MPAFNLNASTRLKQKKAYRNIALSLLLTFLLIFLSSCTTSELLLSGDSRTAYTRLREARSSFKYPSSVRLVSGTVSGTTLYCTVKAKNGWGIDSYGTYSMYTGGIIYESDSSLCYGTGLNTDLINDVLAGYVSANETRNVSALPKFLYNGGTSMWLLYIGIIILYFILNGILASNASDVASSKGEDKTKWFHMCFWLGPLSYIIIAAMPDQVVRNQNNEIIQLLKSTAGGNSASGTSASAVSSTPSASPSHTASKYIPYSSSSRSKECPFCGFRNEPGRSVCASCMKMLD